MGKRVAPPSTSKKITENANIILLPIKISGIAILETYARFRQWISLSRDVGVFMPSYPPPY